MRGVVLLTFGERVKEIRKANGMTQKEFADAICISNVSVSQLESNKFKMAKTTKELLCTRFHINPQWLDTGEGDMLSSAENAEELVPELVEILNGNTALLNAMRQATHTFTIDDWKKLNQFILSLGETK